VGLGSIEQLVAIDSGSAQFNVGAQSYIITYLSTAAHAMRSLPSNSNFGFFFGAE
jgi:hypothetical protein